MKRVCLYIAISILFFFGSAVTSYAFSLGGFSSKPFGGPIITYFQCTCSPHMYLFIGPPANVTLTYRPGIQKYASRNIPLGKNLLGYYDSSDKNSCKIYVGTTCTVYPSGGAVTSTVGSSSF